MVEIKPGDMSHDSPATRLATREICAILTALTTMRRRGELRLSMQPDLQKEGLLPNVFSPTQARHRREAELFVHSERI